MVGACCTAHLGLADSAATHLAWQPHTPPEPAPPNPHLLWTGCEIPHTSRRPPLPVLLRLLRRPLHRPLPRLPLLLRLLRLLLAAQPCTASRSSHAAWRAAGRTPRRPSCAAQGHEGGADRASQGAGTSAGGGGRRSRLQPAAGEAAAEPSMQPARCTPPTDLGGRGPHSPPPPPHLR